MSILADPILCPMGHSLGWVSVLNYISENNWFILADSIRLNSDPILCQLCIFFKNSLLIKNGNLAYPNVI